MTELIKAHLEQTITDNNFIHLSIVELLRNNNINSYRQYQIDCGIKGVEPFSENLFLKHMKNETIHEKV